MTRFLIKRISKIKKKKEYLTISQTAKLIGVSMETLRNWDKLGKLKAYRHPTNNYRLYRRKELELIELILNKNFELLIRNNFKV